MRSIFPSINNKDQPFMEQHPRISFPFINNPLEGGGGGVSPSERIALIQSGGLSALVQGGTLSALIQVGELTP